MGLVIIAALLTAMLFLLFKVFDLRRIPLFPAIVTNYVVAFIFGVCFSHAWDARDVSILVLPSALQAGVFITLFYLMGYSSQRVGIAPTTVASKMSLVLTVLAAVLIFHEQPGLLGWAGIALAVVGVVLSSWAPGAMNGRALWLPLLLFVGNALSDILLNIAQRTRVTALTEAVFPTMIFGFAALFGLVALMLGRERKALLQPRVLIGGTVLGCINYGSIYFTVRALSASGFPASSVFPLMNIGAILFGVFPAVVLFRERLRAINWAGVVIALIALGCILAAHT